MGICKNIALLGFVFTVSLLAGCDTSYKYGPPEINARLSTPNYEPYEMPNIQSNSNYSTSERGFSSATLSGKTIIVDPGHGGKDPGAGSVGYSDRVEKVLNLDIAQELARRLKTKGANVVMTRNDDVFIELDDRAAMADSHNADLLVSIHCDSHSNRFISGATVYTARNRSWKSYKVAQNIVKSFNDSNIECRGIRESDFRVLAKHSRPSVLVECGYLTNAYEARELNNRWYRRKIAKTLAEAIADSF